MNKNQTNRLLAHLRAGKTITPLESWKVLGIYRLAARIYDLRELGVNIDSELITIRNRYGDRVKVKRYWLAR